MVENLKLDKKSFQYLSIVIIIAIIVCIGFFYYSSLMPESESEVEYGMLEELKKERIIKQQLKELEQFGEGVKPLTEQEIEGQLKELDQFQQGTKPLTDEEIQKQLEELNKFH